MGKGLMRRGLLALALGFLAPGASWGAAKLTMTDFRSRVAAEIHRQYPQAKIEAAGEGQLEIELPDHGGGSLRLDRAYALYQGNPRELDNLVRVLVASLAPAPPLTAEALVVLARPTALSRAEASPLFRPLAGDLSLFVAVDRPDSYAIVSADELRAALKLGDAAIWTRAIANTVAKLPRNLRLTAGQPTEISTENGLASSLLAIDAFWDSPELSRSGAVVVTPLARDVILVAPLSDTASVERLRALMKEVQGDPNGLSNDLFVRRNGRWEVLR